jgi:hypothetical protein
VCVCILCVLGVGGGKGGERPGANQDWHHQHVPQKRDLVAEKRPSSRKRPSTEVKET